MFSSQKIIKKIFNNITNGLNIQVIAAVPV